MNRIDANSDLPTVRSGYRRQDGTALVMALFVLALISVFVAFALSRTAAEAAAVGNETAEARTLYAAQGSLETMTRNFNKIFERKLRPAQFDLDRVEDGRTVPGISRELGGNFDPAHELDQVTQSTTAVLNGGPYAGLVAMRDTWRLRTTVTDNTGTQIQLSRNILNNRISIFQFGVFYEDDLELFNGPEFGFGGRVHSNRHFFIHPSASGAYFDSRVTAAGHIVTQSKKNGDTVNITAAKTYIKNASGVYKQLLPDRGSVLNGTPNQFGSGMPWEDTSLPASRLNTNWDTQSAIFDGNLRSQTKRLKLPMKVGNQGADLVEMIRRGKEIPGANGGDLASDGTNAVPVTTANVDTDIQRSERFYNKTGIRISLADSKAKLPGCATAAGGAVAGPCGIRLDGHISGGAAGPAALPAPIPTPPAADIAAAVRGYQPKAMKMTTASGTYDYVPTRVNGERLHTGGTREVWIKVETVATNGVTNAIEPRDITEDFLSLGVTEQAPNIPLKFAISGYDSTPLTTSLTATIPQPPPSPGGTDSRSILKLQRFLIKGPAIPVGATSYTTAFTDGVNNYNTVVRYTGVDAAKLAAGCALGCAGSNADPNAGLERFAMKLAAVDSATVNKAVVPFPIQMFDNREGEHYDTVNATYYADVNRLTRNGVMSMIDIDVANLRRFLRGDFNGLFPVTTHFATVLNGGNSLRNSDIPQQEGWVLYISDRRGDVDFDGEYDMEDIYGANRGNDGVMQPGEDVNHDGVLNTRFGSEAARYDTDMIPPDRAAVNDHMYYRRGVRLLNGTVLPGIYDAATPANTRGFTVASENGVYVQGNYNATHVNSVPATGNTPYDEYRPFDTPVHIPASIVADAVTILSNAWQDGRSFRYPYDRSQRDATTTQMRFAMIAGDTLTSMDATPNQGGTDPRLNGGLHNFKRFLEDWGSQRLDYTGSLINLYNSRNNNGSFKCCNTVYSPPERNWVFDSTFLDPNRIPPGAPYFQYVQTTGFERTTD